MAGAIALGSPSASADEPEPLLSVERLDAWFDTAQILFDLSFSVWGGQAVALVGRNGAGKSTTMRTIMGLVERRAGRVRFRGRDISRLEPFRIARLGLGFTPEDRRIFSELTVLENLDLGQQALRRFGQVDPVRFTPDRAFALFPNLSERRNARGRDLSGGEQQMLSLARTLMGNPLLVLLDEPGEGVAPIIVEQLANAILELKQQGISLLLSEQNLQFARLVCDRVYVLETGSIRWAGAMSEFLHSANLQDTFITV